MIGAVLYYLFHEQFKDEVTWYTITLGVIAVVVTLVLQKGIWGIIRARTGLDLFPVRRRLVVDRSEPRRRGAQSGGSGGPGGRPNHSAIPARSTTRRTARDGARQRDPDRTPRVAVGDDEDLQTARVHERHLFHVEHPDPWVVLEATGAAWAPSPHRSRRRARTTPSPESWIVSRLHPLLTIELVSFGHVDTVMCVVMCVGPLNHPNGALNTPLGVFTLDRRGHTARPPVRSRRPRRRLRSGAHRARAHVRPVPDRIVIAEIDANTP